MPAWPTASPSSPATASDRSWRRRLDAFSTPPAIAFEWEVQEAGEATIATEGTPLPERVLESIRRNKIALKGPITTPVGSGFRSVNVGAAPGAQPVRQPPAGPLDGRGPSRYDDVDLVIVRENTEDLYAGIEHMVGRDAAESIKIITRARLGADRPLRLRVRRRERPAQGHRRAQGEHHEAVRRPVPRVLPDDRRGATRAGSSSRTGSSTTCACSWSRSRSSTTCSSCRTSTATSSPTSRAGLVGGLGVAPGANIGEDGAVFEPVHGSAPKYAGQNKANPTALILSGALMLRHLGYAEVGERVEDAVRAVIAEGRTVTSDLGGTAGTSQFADAVIERLGATAAAGAGSTAGRSRDRSRRAVLRALAQAAGHGAAGLRRDEPPRQLGGLPRRPGHRLHDLRDATYCSAASSGTRSSVPSSSRPTATSRRCSRR